MSRNDKDDGGNQVRMMTMHASKGLEFRYVFIVGCEDGVLPHEVSLEEGNLQEERRLLYVGITRAKEQLWMSYSMPVPWPKKPGLGIGDWGFVAGRFAPSPHPQPLSGREKGSTAESAAIGGLRMSRRTLTRAGVTGAHGLLPGPFRLQAPHPVHGDQSPAVQRPAPLRWQACQAIAEAVAKKR
ncbi:ATP-dependent helicase [Pantoea ananatis]|nr:ATP-dependent helicase [Pantoea ananatis]